MILYLCVYFLFVFVSNCVLPFTYYNYLHFVFYIYDFIFNCGFCIILYLILFYLVLFDFKVSTSRFLYTFIYSRLYLRCMIIINCVLVLYATFRIFYMILYVFTFIFMSYFKIGVLFKITDFFLGRLFYFG